MAPLATDLRLPRAVHPGAWWVWALGLATVASRTTNPLLLALVLATLTTVVVARRSDAPWARSFSVFLRLAVVVLAFRTVAQVLLGTGTTGTVLLSLPEIPLPSWAAGVAIGGPVTTVSLATALVEGARLATMLACIGAANALANPKRLLASLPAALHEAGVAVVVALSVAPSLVAAVRRVRLARRLRGRPDRGVRGMVGVALPVLEDALERSLALAAAMDARGYGRRAPVAPSVRLATSALLLGGLAGVCLGIYGLLDAAGPPSLGLAATLAGMTAAAVGLTLGGRGSVRTRYRPDPWRAPEWCATLGGLAAIAGSVATGVVAPATLLPQPLPLAALPLPVLATLGVLVALLPAWLTPRPQPATPVDLGDELPAREVATA